MLSDPKAFEQDRQNRLKDGREPYVPADITGNELDPELRGEFKALTLEQMERVSRHLVACFIAQEENPAQALEHAKWAARFGARVAAVREIYGTLLYNAGQYREALRELRAAMRMSGRADFLPMVADAERGLGRPEKALEVAQQPEASKLSSAETIELMIVVAGAYADMGDVHTALATLDIPALRHKVDGKWQFRLWLAYADLLELDGRPEEARKWITLAADADVNEETDAYARLGREPREIPEPEMFTDESIGLIDVEAEFAREEREREVEAAATEAVHSYGERADDTAHRSSEGDEDGTRDSEAREVAPEAPLGAEALDQDGLHVDTEREHDLDEHDLDEQELDDHDLDDHGHEENERA